MVLLTDDERDTLAELNRDAAEDALWEFERARWEWLESITDRLVATMQGEGIVDPLGAMVTVGAILADLFAIAGADLPTAIAARIG